MGYTAKAWMVVEAKRRTWGIQNGVYPVDSVRVVSVRATKPTLSGDQEAVEIEITFPDGYFDANSPKIEVTIPDPQPQQVAHQVRAQIRPKHPSAAAAILQDQHQAFKDPY